MVPSLPDPIPITSPHSENPFDSPPLAWIPYSPPQSRGSTFFVPTGSGSQRLGNPTPRSPLANSTFRPQSILLPSPQLTQDPFPLPPVPSPHNITYAPAPSPSRLPPGARPSPPLASQTKLPLAQSSSIMLHSGFWDLLSAATARGSRFYSPSKINTRVEGAKQDAKLKVRTERIGKGIASTPVNAKEPVQAEEDKMKRRISKDMVGEPRAFA